MPAVFISYSRKDFYFAESLAFHLTERGIESWLDANHLSPGGDWGQEIERALDEAHTLILVATPASMRSPYVEREWKRALAQGDRLLVARFRSCKLPPELKPCPGDRFSRSLPTSAAAADGPARADTGDTAPNESVAPAARAAVGRSPDPDAGLLFFSCR